MDQLIYDSRMTEHNLGQSADEVPENHPHERGYDHKLGLGNGCDNGFPSSPNDDEYSRMKHENGHSNDDDICQKCKSIPWDGIPSCAWDAPELNIYMSKAQLAASHCRVCRFIARIIEAQHLSEARYHALESVVIDNLYSGFPDIERKERMHVVRILPIEQSTGTGFIKLPEKHRSAHLVISDFPLEENSVEKRYYHASHMNVDQIRGWIEDCLTNHSECCIGNVQDSLRQLRVIDCGSKTVVPAPMGCHYVALSYVWGQHNDAFDDLQNPPKTIADSIYVTQMLGYQYLWIDRFVRTYHLPVH